ncbi:MAG: hypothetical protein R3F33_06935 [Planctomycetota bacterium]
MRQDFTDVDDTHSLMNLEPGQYAGEVADVRVTLARDGSPRWGIQWRVCAGPLAGRTLAWDNLNWSDRGLPRVKWMLGLLGFDVTGVLELEPDDLLGRRALVQIQREQYEEPGTGQRVERAVVPYRGYEALPEDPDLEGVFDEAS